MNQEIKYQIDLLKKYNVTNYSIIDGVLSINGGLDLSGLTSVPDSDFLKGTTINGGLDLRGLTSKDYAILKSNIKQLEPGYNSEKGYCFFDKILSKVTKVSNHKGYTIYTTPFEYIAQKAEFTAHGKTVRKAIEDLEFKKISEKLKHEPITAATEFTFKYYRALTGACYNGMQSFADNNNISYTRTDDPTHPIKEVSPIKAKDLLPILEKSNAYGLNKFKDLVTFLK